MTETEKLAKQNEELQKQVALLMSIADKNALARAIAPTQYGKDVLVSVFQRNDDEESRLITGWKIVKDYVRTDKDGIKEEQIMEIYLDDNGEEDTLLKKREKLVSQDKIDEINKILEKVKESRTVRVPYLDFAITFRKMHKVSVERTETKADGSIAVVFTWRGREVKLPIQFVN